MAEKKASEAKCLNPACGKLLGTYARGTPPEQQRYFCSDECFDAFMAGCDMCVAPETQLQFARKAGGVE